MKKIIVAGAGHGGLTAAALLAQSGYDVTVYEKNAREDMGYDWHDVFDVPSLVEAGLETVDLTGCEKYPQMCYLNPSFDKKIISGTHENTNGYVYDRKKLIAHLIECAEKRGAKIVFGASVTGVITYASTVKGIKVRTAEGAREVLGDLVIDAAGMDSPVRRNLPVECGIINDIADKDTFYTYRAYYENIGGKKTEPKEYVYFYHCGRPGMDWAITEEEYVDILIGSFGKMPENAVDEAIADFRKLYPYMGEKIVRGGQYAKIPLRKTLPMIVANGYAAVGDSAAMTEPLSGSGITLSIRAGGFLADAVKKAGDAPLDIAVLWEYQYCYFKNSGNAQLFNNAAKQIVSCVSGEEIDYFMQKDILGAKEIVGGDKYTPAEILSKIAYFLPKSYLLPRFAKPAKGLLNLQKVKDMMPEKYDRQKIAEWAEKYEALG